MVILFISDIVGKPGRKAVTKLLPELRKEFAIDVVIANCENLAHGKSMSRSTLQEILAAGVDIGTGGNHTFAKPEAAEIYRDPSNPLVRPYNLPIEYPGQGIKTFTVSQKRITVINLLGELGMHYSTIDRAEQEPMINPFPMMENLLNEGLPTADATIVDFHAEITSEKVGMGWLLDGKVTAVIGTHTHIPTADERILPNGTGYITDAGMVGLRDSSLGVDWHKPLAKFLTGTGGAWEIPDHGLVDFNAVALEVANGRTTRIARIQRQVEV